MRNYILTVLAVLLLFGTFAYSKQSTQVDFIVDKLQKKYEGINDFHADFVQEAEVRALNKTQKAFGEVWFKKPGKMRWNYYSPTKDTIVSDGNNLWYYIEQENQVLESSLKDLNGGDTTSTTLLSGLGKIKELFTVRLITDPALQTKSGYLLELIPKDVDEDEIKNKVLISVNKSDSLVNTIYLFDPFGNQTKVSLLKTQVNKKISDKIFNFKTPKGAEIVKLPASR